MPDIPSLVVATPCYGGQLTTTYAGSLLLLQKACIAQKIEFSFMLGSGDALITRARAELMTAFLDQPEATHLLFIDADIGFQPEQVFRLLALGEDVVAGSYPIKAIDWERMRRAFAASRPNPSAALSYVIDLGDVTRVTSRNGFAKALHVGNGFLLIRRAALLKMCEAYPQLKYSAVHGKTHGRKDSPYRYALFDTMIDKATGEYLSEDFAFCRRWRDIGGEILGRFWRAN